MLAQPVDTLLDNPVGLTHFLDTHQVTVVAIPVDTHRDIKVHAIIHFVGLFLAQIPGDAGTTKHGAGHAQLQGALRRHNTDIDGTLFPDAVVGQQGFVFIHAGRETLGEVLDKIEHGTLAITVQAFNIGLAVPLRFPVLRHVIGQVTVDPARPVIGGVQARAGYGLVAVHQVFAFTEGVQEHRHGANVESVRTQP